MTHPEPFGFFYRQTFFVGRPAVDFRVPLLLSKKLRTYDDGSIYTVLVLL